MFISAAKVEILTWGSIGICPVLQSDPSGQSRNCNRCYFLNWLQPGSGDVCACVGLSAAQIRYPFCSRPITHVPEQTICIGPSWNPWTIPYGPLFFSPFISQMGHMHAVVGARSHSKHSTLQTSVFYQDLCCQSASFAAIVPDTLGSSLIITRH